MAYPPTIPPNNRTNDTPQTDLHPSDHNAAADALTDIVAKINALPWGRVGFAEVTTGTNGIGADTTICECANVALLAGKRYRVMFACTAQNATTTAGYWFCKITDGANGQLNGSTASIVGSGWGYQTVAYVFLNATARTATFRGRVSASGTTINLSAGTGVPVQLLVEDIGT